MPYVNEDDRPDVDPREWLRWAHSFDADDSARAPQTVGELNFAITALCLQYVADDGGVNYQMLNDILGALEGAKHEFYRRVAVPYEDRKAKINGDVYP